MRPLQELRDELAALDVHAHPRPAEELADLVDLPFAVRKRIALPVRPRQKRGHELPPFHAHAHLGPVQPVRQFRVAATAQELHVLVDDPPPWRSPTRWLPRLLLHVMNLYV